MVVPDKRVAQIEVIPFRPDENQESWETLVLKRNEARGGFWQPISGGIHPEESLREAAYREFGEETGGTVLDCVRYVDDGYTFRFTDMYYGAPRTFDEHVVAMVMRREFDVRLSDEHVDFRWVSPLGALALYKYKSNRDALMHYLPIVAKGGRKDD